MPRSVLTERADDVLVVTLHRPDVRNAVDAAMSAEVAAAMDELDGDDGLSVGILAGSGPTFCAGMDLKAFLRGEVPEVPGRGFGGLTRSPPAKPLIAAVEGPAVAGAASWCSRATWWWRPRRRPSAFLRYDVG